MCCGRFYRPASATELEISRRLDCFSRKQCVGRGRELQKLVHKNGTEELVLRAAAGAGVVQSGEEDLARIKAREDGNKIRVDETSVVQGQISEP